MTKPAVLTGWRRTMVARDTGEEHRAATPLELLFDLCFVAAVAQAAAHLHHSVTVGHVGAGVTGYLMVFFAIWWAWVNFTWFASAYDNDDVPYRLATMVEIAGALVIAAGVPRTFESRDFVVILLGYTVMRVALVGQWLRVAVEVPTVRATALRFAAGLSACMVGWALLLLRPDCPVWAFVVMVAAELAVPVIAESAGRTSWHPGHVAERYGLFTLIVLGEAILAATVAVQTAIDARRVAGGLYVLVLGGLLIVFGMWWLYFSKPAQVFLTSVREAFAWSYGHYLIFAAAAAVGAGLGAEVDRVSRQESVPSLTAGAAVTVPVAVFLCALWALHVRPHRLSATRNAVYPGTALLVLGSTFTGAAPLVTGLLLLALVSTAETLARRDAASTSS
ncbi:low temperature requirement protein A [Actinopolymorpha sp. NPDC004070]|uniref:low temperature requirement protein A n=1 Tax=Actinopolymorpha sp. NPDC004070 TaxID=3154548 RepID=UPI0033A44974